MSVFPIFNSLEKQIPSSSLQASLKCSRLDANLFCTDLWKTKNLSLGSGWVGWTVICSWAPDADFFTTPHPSYFSSRDLKALNKPWSSLTPWVIFGFHFPRLRRGVGGSCGIPCLEMMLGWVGRRGAAWGSRHPFPITGWDEGQASRWIYIVWFQFVLLRLFYDWRDSAKESKLEKLKNKQNHKRCR